MFRKILPKKETFFVLLNELAGNIHKATEILHETFSNLELLPENASKIHILENTCDEIKYKIISELNETFVTPIDREDIHLLANTLDNIIDSIDVIARRLSIYKLKKKSIFGPQLSGILLSQTALIVDVVKTLERHHNNLKKITSIKNLETQGDSVFREALTQLFEKQKDVIELIKEKEILETTEKAVDRCQRAAVVLESILIKNV
ncbi:MAG: DUF47 domain-containing protein [Ignavibacteria bacterium]|nr:DUF47 domain-containing protein [Ignavibacteria bacterium]